MNSTGRRFELLIGSIVSGVALWNMTSACLPPPIAPRETSCAAAVQQLPCFDAVLSVRADSSFTFTIRGHTVSSSGSSTGLSSSFDLGVLAGANELTARTSSAGISFSFRRSGGANGGIAAGSLQSVAGPVTTISNAECRVTYAATPTTPRPYDMTIRFNGVTGPGVAIC